MEFCGIFRGASQEVTQQGFGPTVVSFELKDDFKKLSYFNELSNSGLLNITAKKWRKKRSLDANAYAWVLMGHIAEKLNTKNTEVYLKIIREAGTYQVIPIKTEAVDKFIEVWTSNGIGWICEKFPSKLDGYTNVRAFYGSSSYDTKEMSRLIDSIVQECNELNIETLPENELQSLLDSWEVKK